MHKPDDDSQTLGLFDTRCSTPQTDAPSAESSVPTRQTTPSSPRLDHSCNHSCNHNHPRDAEIAIFCALPLEFRAASLALDQVWHDHKSPHTHRHGRIGRHSVILVQLPETGKASAASTAASIRSAYPHLRFAFLVGVCGGVPQTAADEMLLGDVVVSSAIVQYDFGAEHPDIFEPNDWLETTHFTPSKSIQAYLDDFETADGQRWLCSRSAELLGQLQTKAAQHHCESRYEYPGTARDKLFEPAYRHKHSASDHCNCDESDYGPEQACDSALDSPCTDLGCDEERTVPRKRLDPDQASQLGDTPDMAVHVGPVGSGSTTIESGQHRDMIATPEGIIAFETEGSGISEELPCVVVKGVSDYADCHKDKEWQDYAAATSVSTLKALLERFPMPPITPTEQVFEKTSLPGHFLVPLERNDEFIGREYILEQLIEKITPTLDVDNYRKTMLEGPGGMGKTQIALEAAYQIRYENPECSVFWVPADDVATFENAYRDIGRRLMVEGIDEDKADVKALVKSALSTHTGSWLLIIDNADDVDLLFGQSNTAPLSDYFPSSGKGSILFTTKIHEVAVRMKIPQSNLLFTQQMTRAEASAMLHAGLEEIQTHDTEATNELLEFLADLPLAIRQATAYMVKTEMSTAEYLDLCQSSDSKLIGSPEKDFDDPGRCPSFKNPIRTTWLISFNHILRTSNLASSYLSFMCLVANNDIPTSMLPTMNNDLMRDEAITTLKEYAFISERVDSESFDMHRLVQLSMRNWLKQKGQWSRWVTIVMNELARKLPAPWSRNRELWMKYLSHAQAALQHRESADDNVSQGHLLLELSNVLDDQGKYQEAEEMLRQLLELSAASLGTGHPALLQIIVPLERTLRRQKKYEEAEHFSRDALYLADKVYGREHPDTLLIISNLALTLLRLGKLEEAENLHRPVVGRMEKALGEENPHTISAMTTLGLIVGCLGMVDEEAEMHREALKRSQKVLGESSQSTLDSMLNLANALSRRGEHEEAEKLYRQTLPLEETIFGTDNPRIIDNLCGLTDALANQGKFEEAEQIHKQTIQLQEKTLGTSHPDVFSSLNLLAYILFSQGKYSEAEQTSRRALKISTDMLGGEQPETLRIRNDLSLLLHLQGKHVEAEQMHRQILKLTEELLGKDNAATLASMNYLAFFLYSQGKYDEVVQMNRYAIKLIEKVSGKQHCSGVSSTPLFPSRDTQTKLEQMHRQAFGMMEKVLGKDATTTLASMNNLAFIFYSQGVFDSMEKMYGLSLKLLKAALGEKQIGTAEENGTKFVEW